jgi:tetratricopeptide (TPR) repeat protein
VSGRGKIRTALKNPVATACLVCGFLVATCAIAQDTQPGQQNPPPAQTPAQAAAQRGNAAAAPDAGQGASPSQFAFPEDESRKAAEAVKRGENPIQVPDQTPQNNPPASQPAVNDSAPAEMPETNTTSAPPGKLILPDLPMIPSHDNGADGPDGPKNNGYSTSADPDDDPTPANAKDRKISRSGPNAPSNSGRRPLELSDAGSSGTAPAHRVEQDEEVGDFYAVRGNFVGAYLRFKDAVAFAPDEPYPHFGMAEMAVKLGKNDEAVQNYELYLKLEPNGEKSKDAVRALVLLKHGKARVDDPNQAKNPLVNNGAPSGK